jgi:CRISPR-associated protein Csx14
MARHELLATLGTTPAVVTEAIDLLQEHGVQIERVRLITSLDHDVQAAYRLLYKHLEAHDNVDVIEIPAGTWDDVRDSNSAVEFLQIVCGELKSARDRGDRVYVCIAGGRKAMSALLALAVQFYGAERLFHVWVPPWLEEDGSISKLRHLEDSPDELIKYLHPSLALAEDQRPQLVDLPFIGLFPMLADIVGALQGQDASSSVRPLLQRNGLLKPSGEPTGLGRQVREILEQVESLPAARSEDCELHIARNHHYASAVEAFARKLAGRFPFITRLQSLPWRDGRGTAVETRDSNKLEIRVPAPGGPQVRLLAHTTARTAGQLEAARRAVEHYVEQQKVA